MRHVEISGGDARTTGGACDASVMCVSRRALRECSPDVEMFAVRFDRYDHVGAERQFGSVPLPPGLGSAAPRRRAHFRAGRFCARRALAALGLARAGDPLWLGPNVPPRWPQETTGSITHTDGFACAAVARSRDVAALGIDSEWMASPERAAAISGFICTDDELRRGTCAGLSTEAAVTVSFSIKEAVFKCLYPFVGRHFGYLDASLDALDPDAGEFAVSLGRVLGRDMPGRTAVKGTFSIDGDLVHAAVCLPARHGGA